MKITALILAILLLASPAYAVLTADEETGVRKVLAIEKAKADLDAKYAERKEAYLTAQQTVEDTYNADVVALEQAYEDAKDDLSATEIVISK